MKEAVESYCFAWSPSALIFILYLAAGLVGLITSVFEILNRYGAGNKAQWVLIGWPQVFFYLVNFTAAILGLFISEVTEATHLTQVASTNFGLSLLKSAEIGLAAMFVLRSRFISVSKKGNSSSVDLGPAQLLNIIYRYLDRATDQSRGELALQEVKRIMSSYKGDLTDLTAVCLRVPEAIPDDDIVKLRRNLEMLRKSKDLTREMKGLLMGIELQKEVGTNALAAAVDVLKDTSSEEVSNKGVGGEGLSRPSDVGQDSAVVSLDRELDAYYRKFAGGSGSTHHENKE